VPVLVVWIAVIYAAACFANILAILDSEFATPIQNRFANRFFCEKHPEPADKHYSSSTFK